jgi:hypothetical protein
MYVFIVQLEYGHLASFRHMLVNDTICHFSTAKEPRPNHGWPHHNDITPHLEYSSWLTAYRAILRVAMYVLPSECRTACDTSRILDDPAKYGIQHLTHCASQGDQSGSYCTRQFVL